ncbi:exonuclease mut-7 homolog [Anticarsia gemmatalis]|uniref:exonuclease mut-7 homolog n=1 Tax=Anticarsia gemmatalis TaxID=129554 RepID=UPI003F7584AF
MNINRLVCNNQTIKIVPSMEESLHSMGLNVTLDDFSRAWLDQLKNTWKTWKKSPAIENHIETFFQSATDPYRLALIFVVKCDDYKDCKPKSLPYLIIEMLQKWSKSSGVAAEDHLKLPAFHIATHQRNQPFLTLIVNTYQVITVKDKILPIVKDMIRNDNCKQASQIVIAMQLSEDIPVQDLMFPLVLQDKSNLIDDYLSECPSQVQPLLLFLDKLLDKTISIREFVQNYIEENKISHIKYDKVHYKPLGKLVARLCNKYNIPIETCKNLSKNRTTGGLRYLIHQKYQEHNVSASVWEDLVKDSLKQNASSGREFIDMLVEYDPNEALKWASYLNMPEDLLPLALKEISLNDVPEEENWDTNVNTSQDYYKFTLADEQITIIDTGEKFYNMLMSDVVKTNVASIDCEWKPSFGATQSQVALIQIATINRVYLIDTLILNQPEYASFWCSFYKSFLDNAEIIKVGFGLEQDLKEIKSSVVGLGNIKVQGEGLLDLGTLWKNLLNNGLILPGNSDNGGNSLSSVVQSCFGLPLEKSEQCSNWELRPLRSTQIVYAALDAHVLLEIYEFLQKLCSEQQINFEEICNDVMLENKKKCSKKPKVIERLGFPTQSRSVHEVKFLVDHALTGLMPYLRYCGIDTVVTPPTMLWHDVINLAISEDRFILLAKIKYTPNSNFPQSSILEINKNTYHQQLRRVLNSFCIHVEQENLFTFCINCNSKNLTKLNPDVVVNMCNTYLAQPPVANVNNSVRYSEYDEDEELDNIDNFLSDSDGDEELYQADVYHKPILNTSMGVPVEIHNPSLLSTLKKHAILCEACGRLFWDEDMLLKPVIETVYNFKKLKIW